MVTTYKVPKSAFFSKLLSLYYIQLTSAEFVLVEQCYYSENGKMVNTSANPQNGDIIYRRTSNWLPPEFTSEEFESICEKFFDKNQSKTFQNARELIMTVTNGAVDYTDVSKGSVILKMLESLNWHCYKQQEDMLVRMPLGLVNIDIIKADDAESVYVRVFKLMDSATDECVADLVKVLNLA